MYKMKHLTILAGNCKNTKATAFFMLDYGFPDLVFLKTRKKNKNAAHQFSCVFFSHPTIFWKVFSIIS